jgi:hypothetical protein
MSALTFAAAFAVNVTTVVSDSSTALSTVAMRRV